VVLETLARQLVAFDAQISEELAEHLVARALALDAETERPDVAERARRFKRLAGLISDEREALLRPARQNVAVLAER
jgi:hypothetical protein